MSEVLVIGSGPAGLAITTCLDRLGVGSRLVDAHGQPGGAYRRMYGAITLSSPTAFLSLPHLPFRSRRNYVTVNEYNGYLEAYARRHDIRPSSARVETLVQDGRHLSATIDAGVSKQEHYRTVVVATGMSDHPLWPSIPGVREARSPTLRVVHSHDWRGPEEHRGSRLLIIGGGMRAVEIAEECARAALPVTVSARGGRVSVSPRFPGFDIRRVWFPFTRYLSQLPLGRKRHCEKPATFHPIDHGYSACRRAGQIRERGEVLAFEGREAHFKTGPRESFDVVILATGYQFSLPFLSRQIARTEAGFPIAREGESVTSPGLYFLGSPCASGAYSQFIHGITQDARRMAQRIQRRLQAA